MRNKKNNRIFLAAMMMLSTSAQAELIPYNFDEFGDVIMLHGGGGLSQSGRFLTYYGGFPGASPSFYRWDRQTGARISTGPNLTAVPSMHNGEHDFSADGRSLVFHTSASLVVEDGDTSPDSYILDFESGEIELASSDASFFAAKPKISANGRFVLDVFGQALHLYDRETKTYNQIWQGTGISAEISADGGVVVVKQHGDIYVLETETGSFSQLNALETVKGFNLSDDGRFIVFSEGLEHQNENHSLRLVDRKSGVTTTLLSGSIVSHRQAISGDGRFVVFSTDNVEIAPGAPGIVVFDRFEHAFASVDSHDENGNLSGVLQEVSADGHYITLGQTGTNGMGYVVENPLYSSGYCEGYTEFTTD